jgi:hypothetical protein
LILVALAGFVLHRMGCGVDRRRGGQGQFPQGARQRSRLGFRELTRTAQTCGVYANGTRS